MFKQWLLATCWTRCSASCSFEWHRDKISNAKQTAAALQRSSHCSLNYLMLSSNVSGSMRLWTVFVLLLVSATVFPVSEIYIWVTLMPFCTLLHLLNRGFDQSNKRSLCHLIDFSFIQAWLFTLSRCRTRAVQGVHFTGWLLWPGY